MRTRFGAILGLAAAWMAITAWQPNAAAQTCDNVVIQIGTVLDGQVNQGDVPQIVTPGTTVGFFPIVTINGQPARVISADWWFTTTPLQPNEDGQFPLPDENRGIDPDQPITSAQNVTNFTYNETGNFDVGVRVQIQTTPQSAPFRCPQAANTPLVRPEFITVVDVPAADFDAQIILHDQAALVPLNDWVPLIAFNMSFNEDQPAPRALSRFRLRMGPDPEIDAENDYFDRDGQAPLWNHFLEFGIFQDFGGDDGGGDGELDFDEDGCFFDTVDENDDPITIFLNAHPLIRWDAQGFPYERPINAAGDRNLNDLVYDLDFLFDATAPGYQFPGTDPTDPDGNLNPTFSPDRWITAGPSPGNGYILAVRTSSSFPTGQTVSAALNGAEMRPITGTQPSAAVPTDNYPEFPVGEDRGYSSSFHTFDIRGGNFDPRTQINNWNWPNFTYTPLEEFSRPRWDTNVIDFVFGEQLDIRDIFAVETWTPLIGISAHGFITGGADPIPGADIRELNMVFTDVGADPYGPPGNGGFDPTEGLTTFTSESESPSNDANQAIAIDYSFNGVWLFYDTNEDGVFQPPTPIGGSGPGVSFTDHPMIPLQQFDENPLFVTRGLLEWEYQPFPPGGGDPWWKIRMAYDGGRRRNAGDTPLGTLEIVPDFFDVRSPLPKADYFVVVRTDSGFEDVSGITGDGTGIALGADTRAFVEPRRWNPSFEDRPRWDGGILFSQQLNNPENYVLSDTVDNDPLDPGESLPGFAWQEDPRWDIVCPFIPGNTANYACPTEPEDNVVYPYWNERTSNRDTSKPVKVGADVHDLVMTYSTNNVYAKETAINVGQRFLAIAGAGDLESGIITGFRPFMDPFIFDSPTDGPVGILAYRFINLDHPEIIGDLGAGPDDLLTAIQYSYETVPFKLTDDAIDAQLDDPRSFFFPNPQEQPTLPRYSTWPPGSPLIVLGSGLSSYVYLNNENTTNEPFLNPTSSNSEETYRDDEYVAVLVDGSFANDALVDAFLVDENGAKFRITANTGNAVTLARGHAAYIDREFQFVNGDLQLEEYPFGVAVGEANAIRRGAWLVVQDALPRGVYPRQSDWPEGLLEPLQEGLRAARILKQHITPESASTAMLGVNLVGTDDPIVNSSGPISLNSITVAFWGPEFTPDDLQPLDPNGELFTAGVSLFEDTDQSGAFSGVFGGFPDVIVPLEENTLRWASAPEPIDTNGDNIPDDMSGDGVVFLGDEAALSVEEFAAWDGLSDLAWVLRLQPRERWTVPQSDERTGDPNGSTKVAGVASPARYGDMPATLKSGQSPHSSEDVFQIPATTNGGPGTYVGAKALPEGGNEGDDLFVVVRTSDTIGAFERFRAIVPSRLPSRTPQSEQIGGIEMVPRAYSVAQSFEKANPEEGAVQDFYGHDMIEVGVGARIVPVTDQLLVGGIPTIEPGSPVQAIVGLDLSVNRPEHLAAMGDSGTLQGVNVFTTGGTISSEPGNPYFENNSWTTEAIGLYLIGLSQGEEDEARFEAYEITGVSGLDLTLRAGAPRNGSEWAVVRDPTFFEQAVIEFYDQGNDGDFNIQSDLLPLDFEDPANGQLSGVALYRDNDFHPSNTNGEFDPPVFDADGNFVEYIDLPLRLDDPPSLIGTVGGDPENQVRFVFSSPGTDDFIGRDPMAYEEQPRLRQWVPQTFGSSTSDPDFGSDFFVVVRTSRTMALGDDFFVGVSSWGPDTPTEPDPDNFSVSLPGGGLPGQREDEFDIFSEFPWGSRALGFITFFRDPPPIRYWTQDRDTSKLIVRSEVDRSQDDKDIRYWVRSNPKAFGRTLPITGSQPPTVDFTANRIRQVPEPFCDTLTDPPADCGEIQFTLLATGTVGSVLWDFGDGMTSTELNPVHSYQAEGTYTVSVTVTDTFGIEDSATKVNFIEIFNAPLADFSASPVDAAITPKLDGPDGLDVSFVDLSIGTDDFDPVAYFWNFGDGTTEVVTERPTAEEPLVHRYTQPGFYTVTLEVTFLNDATQETQTVQCRRSNLINVRPCLAGCEGIGTEGEGETEAEDTGGEDPPAADFNIQSFVKDNESLVPLNDWVPLFEFTMSFPEDNPAPRVLRSLAYLIKADPRGPDDLNYANIAAPEQSDILEFAIFQQTFDESDEDTTLNFENDFMLPISWDNTGAPVGTLTDLGGALLYQLDFIGDGTPADPEFPLVAAADTDGGFTGNSYIVAVRVSATWRSQTTLSYEVLNADMVIPTTGVFPRNDEGDPIDSYSTDFNGGETFDPEDGYSASFGVYDTTSGPVGLNNEVLQTDFDLTPFNFWNHPKYLYAPFSENTRPAWNLPDKVLNFGGATILQLQELVPMETFWPVIAMNLHSTQGEHFDGFGDRFLGDDDNASLLEVNLVLTDIGADPFGPPGNGGFDAREGLENITTQSGVTFQPAIGEDYAFNGAWVWFDTNGNGQFDAPVANDLGGITFEDRPMEPLINDSFQDEWEWVPLPPGGGDPWWKISLRFQGYQRTPISEDELLGWVEKTPDNFAPDFAASASEVSFDYFIVVRTDSGFQDVSRRAGDGNGIAPGADFRAFIEPRRFDSSNGLVSGGIYVDSMIPPLTPVLTDFSTLQTRWQEDPQFTDLEPPLPSRWGEFEPFWPQRTLNESNAKPVRAGLQVHDLALTYASNSTYAQFTDIAFGQGPFATGLCYTYASGFGEPTDFDMWADPLGIEQEKFFNRHSVGVIRFQSDFTILFPQPLGDPVPVTVQESIREPNFAYETVPFFISSAVNGDLPPQGPRSIGLAEPPLRPAIPDYSTWPLENEPADLQRDSDWRDEDNQARILTQKDDINSDHVALLGINVVGADDPLVNANNEQTISKITVAFWGPDFSPGDLQPLDSNGRDLDSGVLLWEDADGTGVFGESSFLDPYLDAPTFLPTLDDVVPLEGLQWPSAAEPIDVDGDGIADDMNGDGLVDSRDNAWVLEMVPEDLWSVPHTDNSETLVGFLIVGLCPTFAAVEKSEDGTKTLDVATYADAKALAPEINQPGDDLFITIRTSDQPKRFEKIRALIPATLPSRPSVASRRAGIQFFPQNTSTSAGGFIKTSPEEGVVQDFYGHDNLEINVPVKLTSLVNSSALITIGGPPIAALGIDASTNEGTANGTLVTGTGNGGEKSFVVAGSTWEVDGFAGDFLIDERFESYRILSNTADRLNLESGIPRTGKFRIVRNPTFLEEVTVEFYNEGEDADFNVSTDLLPLNIDQELSGVAIYRDNDEHPDNRNGVFDPFIDIPLPLDVDPQILGQTGEDTQVHFTFSSPGTDSFPAPIETQSRNRQWIFDTFGSSGADPASGPDFFVVLRASNTMRVDDNFRVGIVSWGPSTPTEPDPDSFVKPIPNGQGGFFDAPVNDFTKFREFPWADRGLGFISFFKEPQTRYFMDGARAGRKVDNSGFEWVRSHSTKKRRSGTFTARNRPDNSFSVVIDSASETIVPAITLPGESFDLIIRGSGFGTRPQVVISGYEVDVLSSSATAIDIAISTPDGVPAKDPVVVIVRNPDTGEEASRADLLRVGEVGLDTPVITSISPSRTDENGFPVTIRGTNLPSAEAALVMFGSTRVPVLSASTNGTSITVGYPAGGFPIVGFMDVMVRTQDLPATTGPEDIRLNGFEFLATTPRPKIGFLGCAPASAPAKATQLGGDLTIMLITLFLLLVSGLRRYVPVSLLRRFAIRIGAMVAVLFGVIMIAQPAAAFYPIGGFDANNILWLTRWPFSTFDLDNNGVIEADEGLEVIIEVGPSGFLEEEEEDIEFALKAWADVPTSYAAFKIRGRTEDFFLSGQFPDTIQTISMQVSGIPDTGEEVVPDPPDSLVSELSGPVVGLVLTLFTVEGGLLPTPEGGVFVPQGTIIDSDLVISDIFVRPLTPGQRPLVDLRNVMVHELGHTLGLDHPPLNNLTPEPSDPSDTFFSNLVEDAVFPYTGSDGIQRLIGLTPTMFPQIFETRDSEGVRRGGGNTLAPSDISAISWMYPRGSQGNFFNLNHEARSETRAGSGLPSTTLPGAHIVAWADHDNDENTARVPMFSTMVALYEPLSNLGLQGLFDLNYIWKRFEVRDAQPAAFFTPTYTFTSSPLNGSGFERQAPVVGSAPDFDSIQAPGGFSVNQRSDGQVGSYTNVFPSEVFEEVENIIDVENKDAGTPMIWSFELNTLISANTGRTLPTILPNNRPMFGDPNDVCPLNLVQADGGGTTTTPGDGTGGTLASRGGDNLRGFRDGLLLQSALGTALVDLYYSLSPALTAYLKANAWAFSVFSYVVLGFYFLIENLMVVVAGLAVLLLGIAATRNTRVRAVFARLLALLLVGGMAFTANAASIFLTDTELAAQADAVITGEVVSTEGRWALGGRIYTDIIVDVEDTVKGTINKASQFTFSMIGGQVDTFKMHASEMPTFVVGDSVVLFLRELDNGEFAIYAGEQGRVRVATVGNAKTVSRSALSLSVPSEDGKSMVCAHPHHTHKSEKDESGEEAAETGDDALPLESYLDFLRDVVRKQKQADRE